MDIPFASEVLAFDCWRFDGRIGTLSRTNDSASWLPVHIGSRAAAVLGVLLDRPGTLISKYAIMDAVWPAAVEPSNLTVQITALRRVLDDGRTGSSIIQTVPGRGYRFVGTVSKAAYSDNALDEPCSSHDRAVIACRAPRLSLVVLPFDNIGGSPEEDCLAAALAGDLTTDLCRLDGALVAPQRSPAQRDKTVDESLGVRYAISGSVRKLDEVLRVNVQLVCNETGKYLWAGRFDQDLTDLAQAQEQIVNQLRAELVFRILVVESARSLRERPDNPDALDLLIRARSMLANSDRAGSLLEASNLYQRALRLDPSSVTAMCELASQLINRFVNRGDDLGNENVLEQAEALVIAAAALEPNSEAVLFRRGYLSRAVGRWTEATAVLQRLVERFPGSSHGFRQLGFCKLAVGQTEAAIPLLQRSISLDPLAPQNRHALLRLGVAHLLLGDDARAIDYVQRILGEGTVSPPEGQAQNYLLIASGYALCGQLDNARRAVSEAERLWPFAKVGTVPAPLSQRGLSDPAYVAQLQRIWQGLRFAGLREHAEEDAEFGVSSDGTLHLGWAGFTPSTAVGAKTIRTTELAELMALRRPILIDVAFHSWGRSLPDAIGLQGVGHGSAFSDQVQARFHRKIHDLTHGDLSAPIVAFCANAERFTSYNLVLRLVALGYTRVYWYRGGWEAWQVAGLPDTELALHDW